MRVRPDLVGADHARQHQRHHAGSDLIHGDEAVVWADAAYDSHARRPG
ncbi:hypothetical protein [Bradyrhizobium sp. Rc3b]|nr:hypothetical protein [Bradyrhizobium sp. Rc3b]